MQVDEVLAQARDTITVKRVFGDPIERDGLTVIPVANVMGGGGAGSGDSPNEGTGSGVGFGVRATPAGVYIIRDGAVEWQPAVDMGRGHRLSARPAQRPQARLTVTRRGSSRRPRSTPPGPARTRSARSAGRPTR
jgi:hypothetical protein